MSKSPSTCFECPNWRVPYEGAAAGKCSVTGDKTWGSDSCCMQPERQPAGSNGKAVEVRHGWLR